MQPHEGVVSEVHWGSLSYKHLSLEYNGSEVGQIHVDGCTDDVHIQQLLSPEPLHCSGGTIIPLSY